LEHQRFREPCNPLHQGEEQLDTELFFQAVPFILCYLLVEGKKRIVGGKVEEIEIDQFSPPPPFPPHKRNIGIPRTDLDMEEIRETHLYIERNLYIESTTGSLKNIITYLLHTRKHICQKGYPKESLN